jgi:hypothetical protein
VVVVAAGTAVAAGGGTAIAAAAAAGAAAEVAADAPYRSTAAQSSHMRTSRPAFLLGPTTDRRCNLSQIHAVASPSEQGWRLDLIREWELALAQMDLRRKQGWGHVGGCLETRRTSCHCCAKINRRCRCCLYYNHHH